MIGTAFHFMILEQRSGVTFPFAKQDANVENARLRFRQNEMLFFCEMFSHTSARCMKRGH